MRIEANILNTDTLAEKYANEQKMIWSKFVGDLQDVSAYMEYMLENEVVHNVTEIWWKNGRFCVLDIPFKEFDLNIKSQNTQHLLSK